MAAADNTGVSPSASFSASHRAKATYTHRSMNLALRSVFAAILLAAPVAARDLAGDLTLLDLVIPGEDWQVVADGLGFVDAPCSDADGNFYFSDMKAPAIFKVALDGTRTKLADEAASGLKFGPDGRLYACQGGKKRITALDLTSGTIETIAESVQPNDLVITKSGHLFFTDTGKKQVSVVRLSDKTKRVADDGINAPNGLTLSPDQGTLAVSEYRGTHVWTFRVEGDGSLSGKIPSMTMRRPIDSAGEFKFNEPPPFKAEAHGDGMASDEAGRFYVATALGVQIFDPTGRECGLLPKPDRNKSLTSCTLAGTGRAWLYVTSGDKVFRRKLKATGSVFAK
jgi:enterochelin esterase family protein